MLVADRIKSNSSMFPTVMPVMNKELMGATHVKIKSSQEDRNSLNMDVKKYSSLLILLRAASKRRGKNMKKHYTKII